MLTPAYRGRFAPSPTGHLHFGSLLAAVASFVDARHNHGEWLIRIEDVDQTRTLPGSEQSILANLAALGMQHDGEIVRQSERTGLYAAALQRLIDGKHAYRCNCSRKQIAQIALAGAEGPIYPGTCLIAPPPADVPVAWRLAVRAPPIAFDDKIAGHVAQDLVAATGDFIVRRVDGYTAYQLAVVVDDEYQGITHVVRGADLLWSTPRQIYLQTLLGYRTPAYAHVPLVLGSDGKKLSKRDDAHPIDISRPIECLTAAWFYLGQVPPPPRALRNSSDFWQWAIAAWNISSVPPDRKSSR